MNTAGAICIAMTGVRDAMSDVLRSRAVCSYLHFADVRHAEGDRAVPVAGLIFFQYSGRTQGIRSIELIYNGSVGNVTLELRP